MYNRDSGGEKDSHTTKVTFTINPDGTLADGWDSLPPSAAPTGMTAVTLSGDGTTDGTGAVVSGSTNIKLTAGGTTFTGTGSYKWFGPDGKEIVTGVSKTALDGDTLTIASYTSANAGIYTAKPYNTESGLSATVGAEGTFGAKELTTTPIDQAALTVTGAAGANSVTYGETLQMSAAGGSSNKAITWALENDVTGSSISDTGVLTPGKGTGTVTVKATKPGNADYNEVSGTANITLAKAEAVLTVSDAKQTAYQDTAFDMASLVGVTLGGKTAAAGNNTFSLTYGDPTGVTGSTTGSEVTFTAVGDGATVLVTAALTGTATDNYAWKSNTSTGTITFDVSAGTSNAVAWDGTAPGATETATYAPNLTVTHAATALHGSVTFTSSDETVATVTNAGVVTVLKAGTTTIKAESTDGTDNGVPYLKNSKEYTLTVNKAAQTLGLDFSGEQTIYMGSNKTVTITDSASGDNGYTPAVVSSATNVATVSEIADGKFTITPVAAGSTTITVSSPATESYNAAADQTITLTVKAGTPNTVAWDGAAPDATETVTYKTGLTVTHAATALHGSVTFTSSDEAVATVTNDGTVTVLKAGTTTIKAESTDGADNGVPYLKDSEQYTLTVNKAEAELIVDRDEKNAYVNVPYDLANLGAKVKLEGSLAQAGDDTFEITYTKGTGATGNLADGKMTFTAAYDGAVITVTAALKGKAVDCYAWKNGADTADAAFKVTEGMPNVLTWTDGDVEAAKAVTKNYGDEKFAYVAEAGHPAAVTYTSSDEAVATVNENTGEVSILKVGTTTITATSAADMTQTPPLLSGASAYTLTVNAVTPAVTWKNNSQTTGGISAVTYELKPVSDVPADLAALVLEYEVVSTDTVWKTWDDLTDSDKAILNKVPGGGTINVRLHNNDTAGVNYAAIADSAPITGVITVGSAYSGGGNGVSAYTVKYDAGKNGKLAEGAKASERVKKGDSPVAVPEVVANDGWRFLGWSLDGKTVVDPAKQVIAQNMTFTALYAEKPVLAFNKDLATPYIKGILDEATGEYCFEPDAGMSRAEMAAIVARTLVNKMDETKTYDVSMYSDVKGDAWYADYIGFLTELGILTGYADGSFQPEAPIARSEFMAMVMRVDGVVNGENPFPDVQTDDWALEYIVSASVKGYVDGTDEGTFQPTRSITRAEAVKIINGVLGWTDHATEGEMLFVDVAPDHWAYQEIIKASTGK